MFPKNVGALDKKIRIALGVLFLVLYLAKAGWLFLVLGVIALATGFMNTCPLYKLIGMNTNSKE